MFSIYNFNELFLLEEYNDKLAGTYTNVQYL